MRTLCLFVSLAVLGPVSAEEPQKPTPVSASKEANDLVGDLGSVSFAVRQKASRRLAELGDIALPAVLLGLDSADAEVRDRCKTLLPVLKKAAATRSAQSVRDGKVTGDIPLWGAFRQSFGEEPPARRLFADAFLSSAELFTDCAMMLRAGKTAETNDLYRDAVRAVGEDFALLTKVESTTGPRADQGRLPPDFADRLTALVILGTVPGIELADADWRTFPPSLLLTNLSFRARIAADDERGAALKRVLSRLCSTAKTEVAITAALRQCLVYGFAETGRDLARRGLQVKAKRSALPSICAEALGRFGTVEDDLPRLLSLLPNTDEVWQGNLQMLGSEVSDIALVNLVRLTGQKSADYGIDEAIIQLPFGIAFGPDGKIQQILRCSIPGFKTAAAREAAFQKWQAWALANPKVTGAKPSDTAFDPAKAVSRAAEAGSKKIVDGRRLRMWLTNTATQMGVTGSLGVGGKLTIALEGAPKNFNPGEGATGWYTGSTAFDQSLIKIAGGRAGRTIVVEAIDTRSKTQFVESTVEAKPDSVRIVRKVSTAEETLTVVFEQTDKVVLSVRRERTEDGKVLSTASKTAADLIELRRTDPDLFARGLMPVLVQLGCKMPGD